jgi:ligand-binding sensor domain-containing protein/serine phosphatase RsbU (regulator of sigma subunit)
MHTSVLAQKFPFKNYTVNEGLSTNKIISIYQKENNELWLGSSEGINVFDGNSFKSSNSLFKLPNRTVYDINEINNKTYVSTNGGLCIYDGKDTVVYKTSNGLKHNRVFKTYQDRDGVIWIATQGGVHIFKDKITNVDIHPVINNQAIYNIYEDNQGALWFCSSKSGVIRYYKNETKQFLNLNYPHSFVGGILQYNDSTLWAATRSGLYSIIDEKIKKINTGAGLLTNFYDIKKSENGDIWLASNDGVFVYRNNQFSVFTTDNGLIHNTILKIFEDNENSMWFASPGNGISQLINEKFNLFDASNLHYTNVTSIIPKNDSILFLGCTGGVVKFNRLSKKAEKLPVPPRNYLGGFYDNSAKQLIMGSTDGTFLIDDDFNYKIIHSISSEGHLRKCWNTVRDVKGKLWFATSEGVGHLKDSLVSFYNSVGNYSEFVLDMQKDSSGRLYFATELGLTYLEDDEIINYSKEHNFHKNRIREITLDKNGVMWFAGDKGLYKQSADTFQRIEYYHIKNEPLQSLVFDNENNLWAGVSNGILNFNFKNKKPYIRFYSKSDGFIAQECNLSASFSSKNGNVYFGTENGLINYKPTHKADKQIIPKINLTMDVLGISDLKKYSNSLNSLEIPNQLDLPRNNNNISFSFKVVSLLYGETIKFKHQLVGLEKGWKSSNNVSEINYRELPFGSYIFKLKILDHPNLQESDEVLIHFTIQKPFYLQTWFIFICTIIILTWGYSYYLIRKNVKLLNRQQEIIISQKETVEKTNKEIVDSITYAKRIQDAILPKDRFLNTVFSEYFILYKPCKIVSGDFYWVEKLGDEVVFAAADCTGHGVPGAMVSLMCSNLLRKVILEEKCSDPGLALDKISIDLLKRLEGHNETVNDGMDISLCFWNPITNELKFSGANNPMFIIRDGELKITKADKQPIGYFEDRVPFTTHKVNVKSDDQIILFSDGYKDQFGGPKNKKFSSKRFKQSILDNSNSNLEAQEEILNNIFENWRKNEEQIDDVCIFSIKIP